jgi:hypothetical protein
MSLDLSNSNKLDEGFSNFTNSVNGKIIVPTMLPSGDRLEDEFGGSARYPSFNDTYNNPLVEPRIFDAGRGNIYESTPYGYFYNASGEQITDEDVANFAIQDMINFAGSEEYSNGIGKWLKQTTQNVTKAVSDAGKNITQTAKDAAKSVTDAAKDAGKNISQAAQDAKNSARDAAKKAGENIKGGIANAKENLQKAIDSAKKWVGDNLGGGVAVHYLNRVNPVFIAMRGSVIGLMELNTVGIASAMKAVKDKGGKHYEEILQKWWMWGGDKDRYSEAVETGQKKKKFLLDVWKKAKGKKGADGMWYYSDGFSCAEGEEEKNPAKMVAMASSALGGISGVLAAAPDPSGATKAVAGWTTTGSAAIAALGGILKSFAKEQGATEEDLSAIPQGEDLPNSEVPTTEKELEELRKQVELAKEGKELSLVNTGTGATTGSGERLSDSQDNKILGMSKPVFFTVLGIVVIAGGFLTYKLIKKKK